MEVHHHQQMEHPMMLVLEVVVLVQLHPLLDLEMVEMV
jgi:hypothetical protein